jgi:manganese-dependent inorganic pyrophosphatase
MRLEPVGATSTIVAKLFAESDLAIPPPIAGVLLAGILADTLLFRGPTTTAEDRRMAERLAAAAGVDLDELGSEILRLASDVSDRSAEQLLMADFKDFNVDDRLFGIGVIETTDGAAVLKRRDELRAAMDRLRQRGYASVLFAVIDIVHEKTALLVSGHADAVAATYDGSRAGDDSIVLPGIVSRKKDLVPALGALSRNIGTR